MNRQFKSMDFNYTLKIILIGDAGVGKTSLLYTYVYDIDQYKAGITLGVEFGSKTIVINNDIVKVHIWDTSGQERFRSITRSYYRSAAGCIVVYDITDYVSFQNAKKWLNEVRRFTINDDIPIILVGSKNDLVENRTVSYSDGEKFAAEEGILFMETTIHSDVSPLFDALCKKIYDRRHELPSGVRKNNMSSPPTAPPKRDDINGCCFYPFF